MRTARVLAGAVHRIPWPTLIYLMIVVLYAPSPLIGIERGMRSTGMLQPILAHLSVSRTRGEARARQDRRFFEGCFAFASPAVDGVCLD